MRLAQVLVYESDGKLTDSLRPLAAKRGFRLQQIHHGQACLGALRRGGAGILILKVGRDLEIEIGLLHDISSLFPECMTVVVGDGARAGLAGIAFDVGADFVVFRQDPINVLADILSHSFPARNEEVPP